MPLLVDMIRGAAKRRKKQKARKKQKQKVVLSPVMQTEKKYVVKVIDAIMGAGKTFSLFAEVVQYMHDNYGTRFLYIAHNLDEAGEITFEGVVKECRANKELDKIGRPDIRFTLLREYNKLNGLLDLMQSEEKPNISATHHCFKMLGYNSLEIIEKSGYVVLIDETLDILSDEEDKDAIEYYENFRAEGWLLYDENTGRITWNHEACNLDRWRNMLGEKVFNFANKCAIHDMFYWNGKYFVSMYPSAVIKRFASCYILTYKFKGSLMEGWINYNGMAWEDITHTIKSLRFTEREVLSAIRDKILLYTPKSDAKAVERINAWKRQNRRAIAARREQDEHNMPHSFVSLSPYEMGLSVRWYDRNIKEYKDVERGRVEAKLRGQRVKEYTGELDRLRDAVNAFHTWLRQTSQKKFLGSYSADQMLVTCRIHCWAQKGVSGALESPKVWHICPSSLAKKASWVRSSMKSTNEYAHCNAVFYGMEKNPKMHHKQMVGLDMNQYALTEMIQWIWRSSIRNGEPIALFIPSLAMRAIFEAWLDGADVPTEYSKEEGV